MLTLLVAGLLLAGGLYVWSAQGARRAELLNPPLGSFVEVDGVRLHFLEKGKGTPIVLVHGASITLLDWKASIFDDLAKSHRVLAFDRPGYGYSQRPAGEWPSPAVQARLLHDALASLGIERCVLVAHSWAGSLALAYALAYPNDLQGMVLLSPATHPWPGGVAAYRTLACSPVAGPLFLKLLLYPLGRFAAAAGVTGTFKPSEPPEGYREQAGIDLLLRPSQFRADAEDVSRLKDFLALQHPRYPKIRVPLTIITGEPDRIVSSRVHARALHGQLPHSKLVVLGDIGHLPHHSRRDTVLAEIATLTSARQAAER
jgi:pimeloyl-ACP methyl ester carboxylesterase